VTQTHRAAGGRYDCDSSDTARARIARFVITDHPRGGRPCQPHRCREYLHAILHVPRTGCARRHLTSRLHRRPLRGARTLPELVARRHLGHGTHSDTRRGPHPLTSTDTAHRGRGGLILGHGLPGGRPPGFDGAKKVDGVKHHVLVNSGAILVAAVVTPASVQDRTALPKLLCNANRLAPTITHVWLDNGYTGTTVTHAATNAGVAADIVSGPKPARGFIVQPRRWVVERTNGSINHCRRLHHHCEVTLTAHQGFLILSQIALLLRRLDRSQIFDTL
jgi:transposase